MKTPTATYRIQLNNAFDFQDLKNVLPYLSQLGISHIYASPIFQAKKGSLHGYDVTDSNMISEDLGGEADFADLMKTAEAYGLGWLQDIVPNHASYSLENERVYDLAKNGKASMYNGYFDIDWTHPSKKLKGKMLFPFLAKSYNKCLNEGSFSLLYDEGFKIKYGTLEFPLNAQTTRELLSDPSVEQTLSRYNQDSELLNNLISKQFYVLAYWKTTLRRINYRRFFDIIDLVGLCMEDPLVFEDTHRLLFHLAKAFDFGLRVDHIDGLYDPQEYLQKLRQQLPDAYLIIEKILTGKEQLPPEWSIQGTTGYEFSNYTNKVFIQKTSKPQIDAFYKEFTDNLQSFSDLLYESKKTVINIYFLGDIRNLARLFACTLTKVEYSAEVKRPLLEEAVVELLACFPVYRTYLTQQQFNDEPFKLALDLAVQRHPDLQAAFLAIDYVLKSAKDSPEALHVIKRLQQFTGAIMAKGFEDTALYRFNRFLSLNDVGSEPDQFGCSIQEFHEFNCLRQQACSFSLNASSTHDSKRGEDVRARLNVLSEIPSEFIVAVQVWTQLNADHKVHVNGKLVPDKNEEFYLYQTLLGAFPWDLSDIAEFKDRLKQHCVKALREAKKNSNWISPNLPYEEAVANFAQAIIEDQRYLETFLPFQKKVAFYGALNMLSQTLLKITCPGVPDFYQGAEHWNLNLVDPDNRRPVDFQKLQKMLSEVTKVEPSKASSLLKTYPDGKAKLYLIFRALQVRRTLKVLFEEGAYLPLTVEGALGEHVIAFCRKIGTKAVVVVVPRFTTRLIKPHRDWGTAMVDWADTCIILPNGVTLKWSDALTGNSIQSEQGKLPISEVLGVFPAALLVGDR